MNNFKLPAVARKLGVTFASALMASVTLSSATAFAAVSQKPLFLTGEGLPPNILLITDHSESMQEGLDGRVALDWEQCTPGPAMQSEAEGICIAGARNPNSKGSIVKSVGRKLVQDFGRTGLANIGLMGYQQFPASTDRESIFISRPRNQRGTALWRLYHRPFGVDYWRGSTPVLGVSPDFFQDHSGSWDATLKRYSDPHPSRSNIFSFYNEAIPGYERSDFVEFCRITGASSDGGDTFPARCYNDVDVGSTGTLSWGTQTFNGTISIVDAMRQRGIPEWGSYLNYMPLYQNEWRSNVSPGLGYLHVPIGGVVYGADGRPSGIDPAHWDHLEAKLQPQRVSWNGSNPVNPLVDPDWPLIAAGLTPIEGTIQTVQSYLSGSSSSFGAAQGAGNKKPIPLSCQPASVVWVTDGLPSVKPDGTPYSGEGSTAQALSNVEAKIRDFHQSTESDVYIVGFALPPGVTNIPGVSERPLDALAAAGGTGTSYTASDEASLVDTLNSILTDVVDTATSSAASAAASSTSLQTNTAIFVAGFDSRDWTGELKSFRVTRRNSDEDSLLADAPAWNAEDKLPTAVNRNILTWVPDSSAAGAVNWAKGSTRPFTTSSGGLSESQKSILATGGIAVGDLVGWLRGDQSKEGTGTSDLRRRSRVIGDIVNSSPLYIQNQNFNYQLFPDTEGGSKYNAFLDANRSKAPLIAVASNNGMLHVFDARLPCRSGETTATDGCSSEGGKEVFSYVPNALMSRLPNLAKQNYDREYYFDGSPRIGHVYDGTKWRRILVASLGAGGKAVVAIDVDSQEVMWEIDASHNDNLGYVLGDPILGKAASGEWITVIPNGYDSVNNRASLIILNTLTGEEITTWTPTGSNPSGNAMFEPLPLDVTGDRRIDRIYAGDLEGNLWRYDLDPRGPGQWGVINKLRSGGNDGPLFKAVSPEGQKQPITVRPNAARDSSGIIHLVFGTGKYFEVGDNAVANVPTQSLYGIRDEDDTVARSDLVEQSIIYEGTEHGFDVRVSTDLVVGSNRKGWRLDLIYDGQNNGERLVQNPIIRGSRAVFATLIPEPNPNPCEPGDGTGWIMEIDAFNGARLSQSPWDLSGDGFGEESFVNVPGLGLVPASGIRSPVGIPTIPAVVEDHQLSDREYKFVVGSTGDVWELPDESRDGAGRQFWRQLR
ncbi:MAG: hypothetical protein LPK13_03755 [Marinobacter sp.]|uniref:pilus assembly protein n=1 Tax=Marinobacter sp. TaxID=50741 RepID=UPI0029C578F5|nr:PilC/PilY family type IV pilus protein [Marinobacter sp.]MDX5335183.1 hypothetical protein [Marinobacter sp.]MDX5385952.1 hypothetical protein [Marinobacter sp.]MDX5441249.1 hypothetical protein [Alteromonadaceae bacterium]MDX5471497.1 hypothetical protein [Marinobacter sp.]